MKYIAARPSRLYCPGCEDVYALPQGGAVKQYKGLECPLDGFELVLFSLSGAVSGERSSVLWAQSALGLQWLLFDQPMHSRLCSKRVQNVVGHTILRMATGSTCNSL